MNLKKIIIGGATYTMSIYSFTIDFETITKAVIAVLTITLLGLQVRRELAAAKDRKEARRGR